MEYAHLHREFVRLLSSSAEEFSSVKAIKGARERIDSLALLCRDVVRRSTLCFIDGELCCFDGRCYVPVSYGDLRPLLGDVLVDLGCTPTDVRMLGEMPLSVVMEKSYASERSVCFTNGVLSLVSGRYLKGFAAGHKVRERLSYAYDREAGCPLWEKFLSEVMPDASERAVLQEFFGMSYLDRGALSVEKFALFVGKGANGKSVIFEVIKRVLGEDNVSTLDPQQLVSEKMIPYVKGKRLNFSPDVRKSAEFDSALKALSSGQDVTGRKIYGDAEKVKCPPLCFALNELPRFRDVTNAFFRRILLFSFDVQIPPERQDRGLVGKICEKDLPGIFNWVLEGRRRLVESGGEFTPCRKMDINVDRLRTEVAAESYPVRTWLERRGLTVYPQCEGQMYTHISQNEIFLGLKGEVSRTMISRELGIFGVKVKRSKEISYRVYEKLR